MALGEDGAFRRRGVDFLASFGPAAQGRVERFLSGAGPFSAEEEARLASEGKRLLPHGGAYLPWTVDEDYFSLTVMARLLRPTPEWALAIDEVRTSSAERAEDLRGAVRTSWPAVEQARQAHAAAVGAVRKESRVWRRWRGRLAATKAEAASITLARQAAEAENRRRAELVSAEERFGRNLDDSLNEIANTVGGRWTGWPCAARVEDAIYSKDLPRISMAAVLGQAAVGLVLMERISSGTFERLLSPWLRSTRRTPWESPEPEMMVAG